VATQLHPYSPRIRHSAPWAIDGGRNSESPLAQHPCGSSDARPSGRVGQRSRQVIRWKPSDDAIGPWPPTDLRMAMRMWTITRGNRIRDKHTAVHQ